MYNDVGKNKNDQTQRKGSNVHKEPKQQVAKQTHINNRTETTNGFKERKQRFKHKHCKQHTQNNGKNKENTNKHTHRTERNNTVKHTHTENQKLRGKHAHTHKKQQRINIIYSAHAQKQQQIKAHEHMTVVGAARETCATGCLACFEFWMQHVQKTCY